MVTGFEAEEGEFEFDDGIESFADSKAKDRDLFYTPSQFISSIIVASSFAGVCSPSGKELGGDGLIRSAGSSAKASPAWSQNPPLIAII